ncbi:MAG TPA: hypothetical protein VGN65_01570 [Casimicrobiaceae bacterium]
MLHFARYLSAPLALAVLAMLAMLAAIPITVRVTQWRRLRARLHVPCGLTYSQKSGAVGYFMHSPKPQLSTPLSTPLSKSLPTSLPTSLLKSPSSISPFVSAHHAKLRATVAERRR